MAKNYLISVLLSLVDGLTAPLITMNKTVSAQLLALGKQLETTGKMMTTYLTLPIVGAGVASLVTAGNFEKQRVALETLLGSQEKARDLLRDIEEFSARTPFQLPGLIDVSKRLLAFGFAAEEVLDVTKRLGDAAMGDQQKLDQLTDAFGKVAAKGKASMRELNMFTYAGVPIVKALADELDTTTEGIYEMSARGQITFEMVNGALNRLTTGTGQFAGMIDKMAYTLPGLFSTMLDNIGLMGKAFGEEMAPMMKEVIKGVTDFVKWIKNLDSSTKQMIITVLGFVAALGPALFLIGKLIKFFVTGVTPLNLFIMAIAAITIGLIALNEALKKAHYVHEQHADDIQAEIDDTKALQAEYTELQNKSELNREEKQRMADIEEILTKRVGETAFALNDQTEQLEINTEAFEQFYRRKYELMIQELKYQIEEETELLDEQLRMIEKVNSEMDAGQSSVFGMSLQDMYDKAQRSAGQYELSIMDLNERIAKLQDLLAGVGETADETGDDIDDLYNTGGGSEEVPLLTIPTKVKEQLEDLENATANIQDNLQGDLTVTAPKDIVTELVGRMNEINSSVNVKIMVMTDENTNAKILEYSKTGNANVEIDINDMLGNTLSEVMG